MATVRVYKKTVREWKDDFGKVYYLEVYYNDYNENGECVAIGTEDFTPIRYAKQTKLGWIWTWDGQRYNKGGKRWFECLGSIRYRKGQRSAAAVREMFKKWQPTWAEVEIRG